MNINTVCAIVLNWNGAEQTLRCVQSLEACSSIPIVIIDNDSQPEDYQKLVAYMTGQDPQRALITTQEEIKHLDRTYSRCLIKNNRNAGYAGGNNVGIDYAYRAGYDYFWVLNNDVTVEAGALEALLETMKSNPSCGFSASVLVYADNPNSVQCVGGGTVYPWLGKTKLIGKNLDRSRLEQALLPTPDYLMGASMMVAREVVQRVGLMDERYFMYSEEVDWQRRAAVEGIGCQVSLRSFARHADSGSTQGKSHLFHFYRNRAAIMYNRKFHSMTCCIVSSLALASITVLQNRGSLKNIHYGLKGISEGLTFSWR
ncbi:MULTISPECIES: glycosyltransferase family 2 protein [unclassified Pseudomonas]|uniref:glycosyltransferase family 2 protein n=1 Tax=unclassified Pseudomonas TaxID=196821 RepID=UPI002AC96C49|nr:MULTISPECIES: glycosyltransferase family 2 protein [unclassified Pseudomonas]MEB0039869.1 glycosyltransferase family 2 protein [Pseudomonas sp. MH10]MEB0077189.1 glycosyltransferase family 2 protein [Pseudomonas sp. MH10out]MEB0091480.1 glycosyltransferase family 2 protein [Pseudomonas sp. CCI4.2]MEB0101536.1 glycosyltransferase family 2 protein [Pseudomonas sp. CCI3.2]MEB0120647.1 glycosyltransferase family 2 protein [Pseudomonas sp. CCI1.2]